MHFHGTPIPAGRGPDGGLADQEPGQRGRAAAVPRRLRAADPRARARVPDPALRKNEDGVWEYTEPDWEKLPRVVTGHGPASAERLAFRRLSRAEVDWVSRVMLAEAA